MQRKSPNDANDKLLDAVMLAVTNKYGADSMVRLVDGSEYATIKKFTSFGHWGLDRITGGGAPAGRLMELYGSFSSGKSLLIAHLIAACQRAGRIACLDDTEHAYNKFFGATIGINNDKLLYTTSECVEEVFDKMETTILALLGINPNAYMLYAWDSVASVPSRHELETDLDDRSGYNTEKAIAISAGTRKMCGVIGKTLVALVVANQMKKNPAIKFGNPEYTIGGDAIPFWASERIRLSQREKIYDGEAIDEEEEEEVKGPKKKKPALKKTGQEIGNKGFAKVVKNKIVKPFQETNFDILYDQGLLPYSGCVDLLIREKKVVPASKGYYTLNAGSGAFKSDKQWHKKELEQFIIENPEILDGI